MKDREIDDILKQAAHLSPAPIQAEIDRIANSLASSLRPVRPLPPAWVLACALFLICAVAGVAAAALLGPHGIHQLSLTQAGLIFAALALLTWLAAIRSAAEMIPGSARHAGPWLPPIAAVVILPAIFALLFRDYRTDRFIHQGVVCLTAGLLVAAPAALGAWLLLRQGLVVHPAAAGLTAGTLAGLAGVTMLELHCANLETFHVMLWHTAVIPLSGAAGAWLLNRFRRSLRKAGPGTRDEDR